MQSIKPFRFNATDVLAALAFEASCISAASARHAAGDPFPDPALIDRTLDRMKELNALLLDFAKEMAEAKKTSANGSIAVN